jgi:peptidoglycan/LPS O-acetylase OafA/YrhL
LDLARPVGGWMAPLFAADLALALLFALLLYLGIERPIMNLRPR